MFFVFFQTYLKRYKILPFTLRTVEVLLLLFNKNLFNLKLGLYSQWVFYRLTLLHHRVQTKIVLRERCSPLLGTTVVCLIRTIGFAWSILNIRLFALTFNTYSAVLLFGDLELRTYPVFLQADTENQWRGRTHLHYACQFIKYRMMTSH